MTALSYWRPLLLAVAGSLAPALAVAQVSRDQLDVFEARLDRIVGRVSVPSPGLILGRVEAARGYRLPGYGVVFVLSPRALPGEHGVLVRRHLPPARPPGQGDPGDEQLRAIERQVLIFQLEAEQARRAAERQMERITRDVRIRLAPGSAGPDAGEPTEEPPPPPASVAPEQAPVASPATAASPAAPSAVAEAVAPPWRFWFEAGETSEARSPESIIRDVRSALVSALETEGPRLKGLQGDEFVAVAVDFVSGGLLASQAQPQHTLIVRARQRDLRARARGAIGSEELRRRIEISEY